MLKSLDTRRAIYRAEDGDGVLHAVREFVDSLEERHLRMLSLVANAPRPFTHKVVSELALSLAKQELYASPYDERLPLLREVAGVLAAASMRLADIQHDLLLKRAAAAARFTDPPSSGASRTNLRR